MKKPNKKAARGKAAKETNKPSIPEKPAPDQLGIETKQVLVNKDHVYQVGEEYLPSVTTILGSLAKGAGFTQYLLNTTAEESKETLNSASLSGSKIHNAISKLLAGDRVLLEELIYVDDEGTEHRGLTIEESNKLATFVRWWYEYRPKVLSFEKIVYSQSKKYAGTLDFIGKIKEGKLDKKSKTPDNELMFVIDWKSNKSGIYDSNELQVAAYAQAETEMTGKKIDRIAILRLGTRHKIGYEFRVLESIYEPYKAFLGVMEAWKYQNPNFGPRIIDVPIYFELPKIEKVDVQTINKKGKKDADSRIEQPAPVAAVGQDQVGDEKRQGVSDGAGLLPFPGGSAGSVWTETDQAGY
jgi:hypothetical protein